MELKVFSRELEPLGIVDETDTVIWQPSYWDKGEYGDVKILAPITDNNNALLVTGNIVVLHDGVAEYSDGRGEWRRGVQLTYRYITKDEKGAEQLEIQGCFVKKWLGKRILTQRTLYNDTNQKIINALVAANCGESAEKARRFPQFTMLEQKDYGGTVVEFSAEFGASVETAIYERALAGKLGYDILVNERAKLYGFWLYKGDDLTAGNTQGNTPCVFSRDSDNVTEQEYTESIEQMKNTAYVQGAADENGNQPQFEVRKEDETAGLDRDELFIEATDISRKVKDESGEEHEMPLEQYLQLCTTKADAALDEYGKIVNFVSTIDTTKNLKYKRDFSVGDRVTSIERRWGIRIDARITKITQTIKNGKEELEVTFGDSLPSLMAQIQKAAKGVR